MTNKEPVVLETVSEERLTVKPIPCPKCGGSGSFDEPNIDFDPDDEESLEDEFVSIACPTCSGEGTKDAAGCPHCTSVDVFIERADYSSAYVQCNDCGCRGPIGSTEGDGLEETPGGIEAIAAWNRRSPVLASRLAIQAPALDDAWRAGRDAAIQAAKEWGRNNFMQVPYRTMEAMEPPAGGLPAPNLGATK